MKILAKGSDEITRKFRVAKIRFKWRVGILSFGYVTRLANKLDYEPASSALSQSSDVILSSNIFLLDY